MSVCCVYLSLVLQLSLVSYQEHSGFSFGWHLQSLDHIIIVAATDILEEGFGECAFVSLG